MATRPPLLTGLVMPDQKGLRSRPRERNCGRTPLRHALAVKEAAIVEDGTRSGADRRVHPVLGVEEAHERFMTSSHALEQRDL